VKYRFHPSQVTVRKCRQQALSTLGAHLAAHLRMLGKADPLDSITQITPDTLSALGVGRAAQNAAVASRHLWSIRNMFNTGQYEQGLELLAEMSRDSVWKHADRRVTADLRLLAARLYWHRGEIYKSIVRAAQGVWARPIVLVRPVKPLIRRLRLLNAH
jgi:hypothetical protein